MLITACFVMVALLATGNLRWVRWRGLSTLGATTYPLYLLHYVIGTSLIHLLVLNLDLPPLPLFAGVLVLFVVLAWLVHRLVERPVAARLKKALTRGADNIRRHSVATSPS